MKRSRRAKKVKEESTVGPNWLDLPRDVTAMILKKLSVVDIVMSARLVCSLWWDICKDPLMWRSIDLTNLRNSPSILVKICRYVVNQSCGQVEDIRIGHFGTDELLKYIANRTVNLRRIQLANCWTITEKGLSEVAKKSPLLEELASINLSKDSLEAIGQSCPLLKTLKFNLGGCYDPSNDEAFAIAKNMPKLRHLHLIGRNTLTNDGLVAILDGCPHLESLDLSSCFYIDLRGSLGKRCHEQIQDLRLPEIIEISDDDSY